MAYQLGDGFSTFYEVLLLIPSCEVKAASVTVSCFLHIKIFFFLI